MINESNVKVIYLFNIFIFAVQISVVLYFILSYKLCWNLCCAIRFLKKSFYHAFEKAIQFGSKWRLRYSHSFTFRRSFSTWNHIPGKGNSIFFFHFSFVIPYMLFDWISLFYYHRFWCEISFIPVQFLVLIGLIKESLN